MENPQIFPTARCVQKRKLWEAPGESRKTFTMFPATTSPLASVSSFKVASESQKLRSSIIRPQRRGQLLGLKATWVSHCEMTDWSDPVHEVPRSKRTALLHRHSQGLKFRASWTSQSSDWPHRQWLQFRAASPSCTLQVFLLTSSSGLLGPRVTKSLKP